MVKNLIAFQPSTVSYLINDLLKERLLISTGKISHDRGPGKPGNLLTLNNTFAQFLGIYVEGPAVQLFRIGLDGDVLAEMEEKIDSPHDVEETIVRMIGKQQTNEVPIKGIGIAINGLVLEGDKIKFGLREGEQERMEMVGLTERLRGHFPELPLAIENDAHCTAIHYQVTQQKEHGNVLIYMLNKEPFGIGCSILLHGQLYKGKNGAAGQFFYKGTRFAEIANRRQPDYLHTMIQELMPHIATSSYLLDPEKVVFTGSYLAEITDEELTILHRWIGEYDFPYNIEFALGEETLHPGKGAAFLSIHHFVDDFIAKVGAR
ncbi:ROK family protein [Chryseomicrobium excrementi]|nr:ROK family protein [Chryseomicrobium excrementi]